MTGAWGDDMLDLDREPDAVALPPVRDWLFVRCHDGHDWVSFGGRPCPLVDQDSPCPARNLFCSRVGMPSQPAYQCSRCPAIDYGEAGGPGAAFCAEECIQ